MNGFQNYLCENTHRLCNWLMTCYYVGESTQSYFNNTSSKSMYIYEHKWLEILSKILISGSL